jgi:hypothetical protein
MSSGFTQHEVLMATHKFGANAILAKPFDADTLLDIVAELLLGHAG